MWPRYGYACRIRALRIAVEQALWTEVLHVGDSWENDVIESECGPAAVWLNRQGTALPRGVTYTDQLAGRAARTHAGLAQLCAEAAVPEMRSGLVLEAVCGLCGVPPRQPPSALT